MFKIKNSRNSWNSTGHRAQWVCKLSTTVNIYMSLPKNYMPELFGKIKGTLAVLPNTFSCQRLSLSCTFLKADDSFGVYK